MKMFSVMLFLSLVLGAAMCITRMPGSLFPAPILVPFGANVGYDTSKQDVRAADFSLWELYRNNDLAKFLHMMFDLPDFIESHPNNEVSKAILAVKDPQQLCETHPSNELCRTYRTLTGAGGLCTHHPNNELCKSTVMLLSPGSYCQSHPNNEMCRGRSLITDPDGYCDQHSNNDLCKAGGELNKLRRKVTRPLQDLRDSLKDKLKKNSPF